MIGRIIKIGLGAGLLWYGIFRGAKGLIVKLYSYSFNSVDLANLIVRLNLNILVKNPLLVGITLKKITGDVYVQGVKSGTVNTTLNYNIAGGKTHILQVIVNLDVRELGQAALQNIQSGDIRTLTIAFDGKLFVGEYGVSVPLKFDLNYNDLVKK